MLKTNVKKLVVSLEKSAKLSSLGIINASMLHWYRDIDGDDANPFNVGFIDDPSEGDLSAWTFEELRVMIGWKFGAADFPEPRPKAMVGEETTFVVNFPKVRKQYKNGAEGNADILIYLIEEGMSVDEINERYQSVFINN